MNSSMTPREIVQRTHASEWKQVSSERWERFDEWGNLWRALRITAKSSAVS